MGMKVDKSEMCSNKECNRWQKSNEGLGVENHCEVYSDDLSRCSKFIPLSKSKMTVAEAYKNGLLGKGVKIRSNASCTCVISRDDHVYTGEIIYTIGEEFYVRRDDGVTGDGRDSEWEVSVHNTEAFIEILDDDDEFLKELEEAIDESNESNESDDKNKNKTKKENKKMNGSIKINSTVAKVFTDIPTAQLVTRFVGEEYEECNHRAYLDLENNKDKVLTYVKELEKEEKERLKGKK